MRLALSRRRVWSPNHGLAAAAAAAALALGAGLLAAPTGATAAVSTVSTGFTQSAGSPDVVIAEVYGGGGNGGSLLKQDFVELHNNGAAAVDLTGWSVQYTSAAGGNWQVTPLTGAIQPGASFLVGEAAGAGGTIDLPAMDASGSIAMSATGAKVALATVGTALGCGTVCHADPAVRDYVGWGVATDFEGSAAAPITSNPRSITRNATSADTDNNATDFALLEPPMPMNSAGETPDYGGDDPIPQTIPEIQGAGHLSADDDVLVVTTGVTTARSGTGYWIQDPTGDGDTLTSDGLFVYTSAAGAKPEVGDAVTVTGTVSEFRSGSASGPGLSLTELSGSSFTLDASAQPLPAPVLVGGPHGVAPPPNVVDDDSQTRIDIEVDGTFDPGTDAIDWWEQYEGMRLQVESPMAVSPTNSYGEIVVLPRGKNPGYQRSANSGVVYSSYDRPNPRRLTLDDVIIGAGNMPDVNTGDRLDGPIVGPLDYGFDNWRLYPTTVPTATPGDTVPGVARPAPDRQLSVATFNVENLDPTDPPSKFDALAAIVVDHLLSPRILALEEVQDNNGATDDGTVAADQTLQKLVTAIGAAGGPTYSWRQIDPQDKQDGGEPGGNIRVAFLFQEGSDLAFVDRGDGDATTATEVTEIDGKTALTLSPGRVDPQNPAWDDSRKPLAGEFVWRGKTVFVIANHFASKGGDEPLMGRYQPPDRSSETKRHAQAATLNAFVDALLASDPQANVVVLGDINDFEFSDAISTLTDDGADLADLIGYKAPRQRWTYVFNGNSQVLDHILVSPALSPDADGRPIRPRRDYEVVHVNADFANQASDHDPQLVRIRLGRAGVG